MTGRGQGVAEPSAHLRGPAGNQELDVCGSAVDDDRVVNVVNVVNVVAGVPVELFLVGVAVGFGDNSAENPAVIGFGDQGECVRIALEIDGLIEMEFRSAIDFGLRVLSEQGNERRPVLWVEAAHSEAQLPVMCKPLDDIRRGLSHPKSAQLKLSCAARLPACLLPPALAACVLYPP